MNLIQQKQYFRAQICDWFTNWYHNKFHEVRRSEIIATNKFVTIPELAETLRISTTAVENNLAKLKSKKVLKRIGPDKGGHWEIVKD